MSIEQIKINGQINALKKHIDHLQWKLTKIWECTKENGHFTRLGDAMNSAEDILADMGVALRALKELEPENR